MTINPIEQKRDRNTGKCSLHRLQNLLGKFGIPLPTKKTFCHGELTLINSSLPDQPQQAYLFDSENPDHAEIYFSMQMDVPCTYLILMMMFVCQGSWSNELPVSVVFPTTPPECYLDGSWETESAYYIRFYHNFSSNLEKKFNKKLKKMEPRKFANVFSKVFIPKKPVPLEDEPTSDNLEHKPKSDKVERKPKSNRKRKHSDNSFGVMTPECVDEMVRFWKPSHGVDAEESGDVHGALGDVNSAFGQLDPEFHDLVNDFEYDEFGASNEWECDTTLMLSLMASVNGPPTSNGLELTSEGWIPSQVTHI